MQYSKSRKVNALVKLVLKVEKMRGRLLPLTDEMTLRYNSLKGGQMAEYKRIREELFK